MKNALIVALDLEMNQPSGRIIQIGAVVGDVTSGVIRAEFSQLVNPEELLAKEIVKLTGITQAEVDQSGTLNEAYLALQAWLAPFDAERVLNPLTWGGGDTETLREHLGLEGESWLFGRRWIDVKTLFVAWRMAQGREISGGLARSMTKLGLAFEGRKHNARDDARNTFRMYLALLRQFQVSAPPAVVAAA